LTGGGTVGSRSTASHGAALAATAREVVKKGLDLAAKQLEVARGLLLNPQLVLIDEPSIGLSPLMVQQTFNILKDLRDRGVSILMIEQNARSALEISDYGIVLELGQTRLVDTAERVLNDPRIGQLFLGGAMTETAA